MECSVEFHLFLQQIPHVNNAALVVAYENGDPAHIHFLDAAKCQYYWKKWLEKLHLYWVAKSKGDVAWSLGGADPSFALTQHEN